VEYLSAVLAYLFVVVVVVEVSSMHSSAVGWSVYVHQPPWHSHIGKVMPHHFRFRVWFRISIRSWC
jgi:hypothetical protein